MALRQRIWAWQQTIKLRHLLGNKCNKCKRKRKDMQFDCIESRGDYHHNKMEWSWRISFYRKQLKEGNLQLLCSWCHGRKSRAELDNQPF
mgnify:CR=1 FL=1